MEPSVRCIHPCRWEEELSRHVEQDRQSGDFICALCSKYRDKTQGPVLQHVKDCLYETRARELKDFLRGRVSACRGCSPSLSMQSKLEHGVKQNLMFSCQPVQVPASTLMALTHLPLSPLPDRAPHHSPVPTCKRLPCMGIPVRSLPRRGTLGTCV